MENFDFSSFAHIPIIDGHLHFIHPHRLEETRRILRQSGCLRANLVCTPNPDATTHNPAALFYKSHFPSQVYISAALEYAPALADLDQAPAILADQVRSFRSRGFDGLKLIEGKPQVRKLLPYPMDGWLYEPMWAVLEEQELPVVFHVADPDNFWDPQSCPDWARQFGWDYSDGTYPSKEDFYNEVDALLTRHPHLKIIFAHFYFLSADLTRAVDFLEAHPKVCFDLAPHFAMYRDFSQVPTAARDFFLRYQDRLIYGCDIDTLVLERREDGFTFMLSIPWLIRSFLEREGEFSLPGGEIYHALGLPDYVLHKIYHNNFERLYGGKPTSLLNNGRL